MKPEPRRGGKGAGVQLCGEHQILAANSNDPRDRPTQRWAKYPPRDRHVYGAAHVRMRRLVLDEEPQCRLCDEPSLIADHIIPKCLGGSDERANLQALCAPCSAIKSSREGNLMRWHVYRPLKMERGA